MEETLSNEANLNTDGINFLGSPLFDFPDFYELLFTFGMNAFFLLIIVKFIYIPANKRQEYLFTFIVFNVVIFFLCSTMGSSKFKNGFAFGLFAILSVLRYRTETVPIKEMTYLFVCITLAVINALFNKSISLLEILATNSCIVAILYILEIGWAKAKKSYQTILYEKIELIKPDKREELITDLKARTGLNVQSVEISSVNLLTDSAVLKVAYIEN